MEKYVKTGIAEDQQKYYREKRIEAGEAVKNAKREGWK